MYDAEPANGPALTMPVRCGGLPFFSAEVAPTGSIGGCYQASCLNCFPVQLRSSAPSALVSMTFAHMLSAITISAISQDHRETEPPGHLTSNSTGLLSDSFALS